MAGSALGQSIELENFSSSGAKGAVRTGSSWVGNVQRSADLIVVGGTAKDDNGWGGTSAGLDISAMRYVTITGQRNSGHEGTAVVLELLDGNLNSHVVSAPSVQFSTSAPTAVEIPLGTWTAGFDATKVREWSIGGGTPGLLAFRMNLDQVFFSATASPAAPTITVQPTDLVAGVGGTAAFTVSAAGATSYRWYWNGVPVTGATTATLQLTGVTAGSAGSYRAEAVNANGSASSREVTLQVIDLQASHGLAVASSAGYSSGGTVTLSATITYSGQLGAVALQVLSPSNWLLVSDTSAGTSAKPASSSSGLLEWRWAALPASPVTFTYTLLVPPEELGAKSITSRVQVTAAGISGAILARPDPLIVAAVARPHTADKNGDYRIDLIELTRVIELYNTRNQALSRRTGAYLPDSSGEDGFAANLSATGPTSLSRYHDADTSRDGQISLFELTRVIELYNTRAGLSRTGQYRVSSGTEDGYAPGGP
jgi:hypothetical protein